MPRLYSKSLPFCQRCVRWGTALAVINMLALSLFCQTTPVDNAQRSIPAPTPKAAKPPAPPAESKRIFGLFPNYRTSPSLATYKPLTTKEKYKIGLQDSFDRGAIILSLAFAAKGQLSNSNPSFGQGTAGFFKYFGAGYADVIMGNMLTESIYPSLLHQDPRYFRRGTGNGWSRLGYSMSRIFVTRSDRGRNQFNYSEVFGNATGVLISNSYYPDNRDVGSNFSKFGVQIGIDMAGNVLKEFAPDVVRHFTKHPKGNPPANH
jgi:hypothetical protein